MLRIRELGVAAGGRTILRDVSFEVARGEVVVVLGPNGAGKTTLLEAIAGLREQRVGQVQVAERTLERFEDHATAIAYMPDDARLPDEMSLARALGLHRDSPLLERFGVATLLTARATALSRGEQVRARLCATLGSMRPVLLLDEPFAAFDPHKLRRLLPEFLAAVRERATLVTVHQMRTAELIADRVLLLVAGRAIAFGTLDELQTQAGAPGASLEDVFIRLLDREDARALA